MSHENADVVTSVVTLMEELTDEDVLEGLQGVEEDRAEANAAINEFADALVSAALSDTCWFNLLMCTFSKLSNQAVELVVSNLDRFLSSVLSASAATDGAEEADEQGIYHSFAALENLLSLKAEAVAQLLTASKHRFKDQLLKILLNDAGKEKRGFSTQNRSYAAELLAMLAQQSSPPSAPTNDGVSPADRLGRDPRTIDGVLQALSVFRSREPADAEEQELMENLFDAICALLVADAEDQQGGKARTTGCRKIFLDKEGIELMVMLSRTKFAARWKALKVLDHAMSGVQGTSACLRFVESLGLKGLFSNFMSKVSGPRADPAYRVTEAFLASRQARKKRQQRPKMRSTCCPSWFPC